MFLANSTQTKENYVFKTVMQNKTKKRPLVVLLSYNHVDSPSVVVSKLPWQETLYVQKGIINK